MFTDRQVSIQGDAKDFDGGDPLYSINGRRFV
jgi:hypothetical protein